MPEEIEELLLTRKFRVLRLRQLGRDGKAHDREVVVHPGAVTIVPMVDDDHVCLIRNARVAVGETLIELPAGTLEAGEDPLETARRELTEETGYRAGSLEKLCEFYMSPGILNERMHLYLARQLTAGEPAREPGEDIETLVVRWDEALALAMNGGIQDAKSLVGLLNYEQVRRAASTSRS